MNESLIQGTTDVHDLAQELREMADRMDLNSNGNFGGACVIVDAQGNVIKTIILDKNQEVAQFWGFVKAKIDDVLFSLESIRQNQQNFGRR